MKKPVAFAEILAPVSVATLALATLATPAAAQDYGFPRNPNIAVEYVAPAAPNLGDTHNRMRKLEVLQTLQEFLSPLKLKSTVKVRMDSCGGKLSVPYRNDGQVTVCYEHIAAIRAIAPADPFIQFDEKRKLSASDAIAGGVARLMLYETSFAVFDSLGIPVWGRMDEAADNVTALIMLDFGEELAWSTILGSAWYLAQRGMAGTGFFTEATQPYEAQRFFNYLCLAFGRAPQTYGFLVNGFNLPEARARTCVQEYHRASRAFRTTFRPHMDSVLHERVRARRDWLKK